MTVSVAFLRHWQASALAGYKLCFVVSIAVIGLTPGCRESGSVVSDAEAEELEEIDLEQMPLIGRYEVFGASVEPESRFSLLLDTSLGRVWVGKVPEAPVTEPGTTITVAGWMPVPVSPEPESVPVDVGRFSVSVSLTHMADTFLIDSADGRVWCCRVTSEGGLVFEETPVGGR
jgi:hypothetical protein